MHFPIQTGKNLRGQKSGTALARKVVRNINITMLVTYFEMGTMIIEDEQKGNARAGYAEQTLKELSNDLTREFGKGFSHRNLEYFRKFYLNYGYRISKTPFAISNGNKMKAKNGSSISQTLSAFSGNFHLSWSHYVLLMKINNKDEQSFYENRSSRGQLVR